jgi:hypothetical protein
MNTTGDAQNHGMPRRQFLALGSTGLSGLLLGAAAPALASVDDKLPGKGVGGPVSLGYWQGSENLPELDWATAKAAYDPESILPIVPATLLRSGDPAFAATGVWLTIHGLYPEPQPEALIGRATLYLDVVYGRRREFAHYAWNLRGGASPNQASRVRVYVPVDQRLRGLLLRGEVRGPVEQRRRPIRPASGQTPATGRQTPQAAVTRIRRRTYGMRMTLDAERGVPRLRRGYYLLGLPGKVDGLPPDWVADLDRIASPEFSCVLLSVEYGDLPK